MHYKPCHHLYLMVPVIQMNRLFFALTFMVNKLAFWSLNN